MAKARRITSNGEFHGWWVECPGCETAHIYDKRWTFNGDVDKPSYLGKRTWGPLKEKRVCHSWVTDGKIQFLNDCTHRLKGQTVDLPDLAVVPESQTAPEDGVSLESKEKHEGD